MTKENLFSFVWCQFGTRETGQLGEISNGIYGKNTDSQQ